MQYSFSPTRRVCRLSPSCLLRRRQRPYLPKDLDSRFNGPTRTAAKQNGTGVGGICSTYLPCTVARTLSKQAGSWCCKTETGVWRSPAMPGVNISSDRRNWLGWGKQEDHGKAIRAGRGRPIWRRSSQRPLIKHMKLLQQILKIYSCISKNLLSISSKKLQRLSRNRTGNNLVKQSKGWTSQELQDHQQSKRRVLGPLDFGGRCQNSFEHRYFWSLDKTSLRNPQLEE